LFWGATVRNVAVNDLGHGDMAIVRGEVEGLGLDIRRIHALPFQIISSELRIFGGLSLFGDRSDG
jgi:hypothetical protein